MLSQHKSFLTVNFGLLDRELSMKTELKSLNKDTKYDLYNEMKKSSDMYFEFGISDHKTYQNDCSRYYEAAVALDKYDRYHMKNPKNATFAWCVFFSNGLCLISDFFFSVLV